MKTLAIAFDVLLVLAIFICAVDAAHSGHPVMAAIGWVVLCGNCAVLCRDVLSKEP
jgi:hypothetical protein